MSWQTYVDDHLMCDIDGTGHHLTASAIIGHDGSIWAQSASFPQIKADEINGIMKDFDEPGYLAPTGLHLAGTKYMVIQGEPGAVIRGKKGSGGITIKKTGQALVFGMYDEPVTPGQCNMVVERLGDYLVDQERINGSTYDYSSDIWSLGMVVLECAIGRFPYIQSEDQQNWPSFYELLAAIVESPPPSAPPDQFSPEFCSFVSSCIQKDPQDRLTSLELLDHPFINKFEDKDLDLGILLGSLEPPVNFPR